MSKVIIARVKIVVRDIILTMIILLWAPFTEWLVLTFLG